MCAVLTPIERYRNDCIRGMCVESVNTLVRIERTLGGYAEVPGVGPACHRGLTFPDHLGEALGVPATPP
jgi:hypothetical protein